MYKLFGINAELLIDHAWGFEPVTMEQIKKYVPDNNSINSGQVLHCPYDSEKARLIVKEMADTLVLDMVSKDLVTNQIILTIGYDVENLTNPLINKEYCGEVTIDRYGRNIPKHAHGTINLEKYTSSTKIIMEAAVKLYDQIINPKLLIRRINIVANHVINSSQIKDSEKKYEQLDFFTDYAKIDKEKDEEKLKEQKERNLQHAVIDIKRKYGKNAILKGINFEEGGTTIERNEQIGGHKE